MLVHYNLIIEKLENRIQRVLDLHRPNYKQYCLDEIQHLDCELCRTRYPCQTVQAIDKEQS